MLKELQDKQTKIEQVQLVNARQKPVREEVKVNRGESNPLNENEARNDLDHNQLQRNRNRRFKNKFEPLFLTRKLFDSLIII